MEFQLIRTIFKDESSVKQKNNEIRTRRKRLKTKTARAPIVKIVWSRAEK